MSPPAWATALLVLAGIASWQLAAWGWRSWRRPRVEVTRVDGTPVIDLVDLRPLRAVFVDRQRGERWLLVRSAYRHSDDGRTLTLDLMAEASVERRAQVEGHPLGNPWGTEGAR